MKKFILTMLMLIPISIFANPISLSEQLTNLKIENIFNSDIVTIKRDDCNFNYYTSPVRFLIAGQDYLEINIYDSCGNLIYNENRDSGTSNGSFNICGIFHCISSTSPTPYYYHINLSGTKVSGNI
ncbi:hypothetical protein [Empedobacter tilapiae]|uniref:Uncharacterized protein n=1 Tax=Empedobacter tilapiae TaxID=2491114 RepID=A0A4Z1BHA8_9FLAO|nr:hypothetical protein [Empedobacter tilapiae]TGN27057.1 hypothetical protein E4J94_07495 [Empedobacter tilapiae]